MSKRRLKRISWFAGSIRRVAVRLDLVQVEQRRVRRKIPVAGFLAGQHGGILSSVEQLHPSERELRLSNLVEKFIEGLA
jgi:hypothetical protein